MDKFLIKGPSKVRGIVNISGSKNAALPILASTILFDKTVILENLPRVKDIDTMINGHDNSPNPFNPVTNIRYELLQKTKVNILIFDINGRKVKDLLKREQEAGLKSIKWNATDNNGRQVSAGLYFYTLEAGSITTNGKMLLLK